MVLSRLWKNLFKRMCTMFKCLLCSYYSMTKIRRTVNFSVELDGVLGLLSTSSQQNLSEFLEYRLRELPEVKDMLQKIRTVPELPPMIKGKTPKLVHNESEPLPA